MAERSLSDLNIELEAVNKSLDEQTVGQGRLIDAVEDLVRLQRRNLDDLESKIEDKDDDAPAAAPPPRGAGGGGSSGFNMPGMPSLGAMPGLAAMAATSLLKKGVPGLLLTAFADEVGDLVTSKTGNAEIGDAVERGMVAGGILSIFSKRLGIIGGLIGAAMTDENQAKAKELFENELKPRFDEFRDAVGDLGLKLPTVNDILTGLSSTMGGALDGLTALAKGDFKGFGENLTSLGLTAAGIFAMLAPGSALRLGMKGVTLAAAGLGATLPKTKTPKPTGGGGAPPRPAPGSVVTSAAGNKVYAGVDGRPSATKVGDKKGLKAIMDASSKTSGAVSKFPKLVKALKFLRGIPGIGALAAITELATMDPVTVEGLAGVLGGLGGSALGGIAGGIVGSVLPGPGTVIGTILGGGAGFFFGDAIAKGLAQFLLGKTVDAFPNWMGINDLLNKAGSSSTPMGQSPGAMGGAVDGGLNAAAAGERGFGSSGGGPTGRPRTTGASVAQSVNQFEMNRAQPAQVINAPSTNMSIGQSTTTFAGGGVSTTDPRRPDLVGLPSSF